MKMTKKILSLVLAAALVLGSVAVAANAAGLLTQYEGSEATYTLVADKKYAMPGDTVTVEVYLKTNYYLGSNGSEFILWNSGVFDEINAGSTVAYSDFACHWKQNYNPAKPTMMDTPYTSGYSGVLLKRLYDGANVDVVKTAEDNTLLYTLKLKVSDGAAIGSTATIFFPEEQIMFDGSTLATNKQLTFQAVNNSDSSYSSGTLAKKFAETVNANTLTITIGEEKVDETTTQEPTTEDPGYTGDLLTQYEGSEAVYTIVTDKKYAMPGDKVTVEVYLKTNYYLGSNGSEFILWDSGVFNEINAGSTVTYSDFACHWKQNYNPAKPTMMDTPYTSGYSGVLLKRLYDGANVDIVKEARKNTLLYTLELVVNSDATIGDKATIFFPAEQIMFDGSTLATNKQLTFQAVNNSDSSYSSGTLAKKFAETVKTNSVTITIGEEPVSEPDEPTTEEPVIEYADLTALKAAIAKAADADTANCTAATVAEFNEALAAAEALNKETTLKDQQDAVNAAAQRLEDAITGLKKLAKVDYSALEAAKDAYEVLSGNAGNYSNWDEYAALYIAALEIDTSVEYDNEQGTIQAAVDAAAKALNEFVLVEYTKVNYDALNDAIAAYEAKLPEAGNYSNWAAYEALYNEAKAIDQSVVYDKNGEQAAADAAAEALNTFVLTEYAKVNYDALNDAIAAYEAKVADKDIYSNWAAYEALYNEAKEIDQTVVYNKNGEQAAADAAADALNTFVLTEYAKVNYDALNDAIAAYEAKLPNANLYANWAEYEALYNVAKAIDQSVVYDKNGEQAEVDAAAEALANFQLEDKTLSYDKWNAAVNAIPADLAGFKPASVTAYEAAKAQAEADKDAAVAALDQTALDAAADALTAAIALLEAKADNSALVAAVARASALLEENYTPDSWVAADLANVLAAANVVLANGDATAEEIAEQVAAIEAAEDKLVVKADKAALLEALQAAQALVENEAAYTPASFAEANLAAVMADAQVVYDDDNATAQAVADAITALKAAEAKLVLKADKAALEAAINTEVVLENATSATLAAYNEALEAAQAVLADDNASEEEVLTATNNLLAAIDGMKYLGTCDYDELNAVIAEAEALNPDDYTTTSWYSQAYLNAYLDAAKEVAPDMIADEAGENQAIIDAATLALRTAIDTLELRANLADLKAAIAAEPKVAEEYATEDTWAAYAEKLAAAQAIVDEEYAVGVSRQAEVDEAAAALAAANDALAEKPADYTAVEEALALVESKGDLNQYTQASVKKLQAAINAVVYGLGISKQQEVDDAAAAIVDAANALVISEAAVTNVEMLGDPYYKRETRQYEVTVTGAPSKIQLINYKGGTQTYDRYHRNVTIVSYDAQGNVVDYTEVEPAYEVWTVSMSLGSGAYQFKAKFGKTWEAFTYEFDVEIVEKPEAEIIFVAAPADGSAEAGKSLALTRNTKGVMTVVVPTATAKVQLAFSIGCTSTYTSSNATVVDNGDGTETWTIIRNFSNVGEYTMSLKLKDKSGWYDAAAEAINVTVTK